MRKLACNSSTTKMFSLSRVMLRRFGSRNRLTLVGVAREPQLGYVSDEACFQFTLCFQNIVPQQPGGAPATEASLKSSSSSAVLSSPPLPAAKDQILVRCFQRCSSSSPAEAATSAGKSPSISKGATAVGSTSSSPTSSITPPVAAPLQLFPPTLSELKSLLSDGTVVRVLGQLKVNTQMENGKPQPHPFVLVHCGEGLSDSVELLNARRSSKRRAL